MAIVIYREGESKRIEGESLPSWLKQGWTTKNPNPKIRKTKKTSGRTFVPEHIGHLDIPSDATPLEAQEIVLGKMNIRV